MDQARFTEPIQRRFWAKVDRNHPSGCWVWLAGTSMGYGTFNPIKGKPERAHRYAFMALRGAIPRGLVLDHLCRNRRCVNPEHLDPVTHAENTRRGQSPAAIALATGLCKRGHRLDDGYLNKRGHRFCRLCRVLRGDDTRGRRRGRPHGPNLPKLRPAQLTLLRHVLAGKVGKSRSSDRVRCFAAGCRQVTAEIGKLLALDLVCFGDIGRFYQSVEATPLALALLRAAFPGESFVAANSKHLRWNPPQPDQPGAATIRARIRAGVVVDANGCWTWRGPICRPWGYGKISVQGGTRSVHRVAYQVFVGPIADHLQLDHLCGVAECANPDHLRPATAWENTLRSSSAASRNAAKTHCPSGHRYSAANTRVSPRGARFCRTCTAAHDAAYRQRMALAGQANSALRRDSR